MDPTILTGNALHLGRHARVVVRKITFLKCASQKAKTNLVLVVKNCLSTEVNVNQESSNDGQIDDITTRVKSLYYNYVHFNSINTHMHINLKAKSCNGTCMTTRFKVNTGADGNLLP